MPADAPIDGLAWLIERSSLGTAGARELRSRTDPDVLAAVRRRRHDQATAVAAGVPRQPLPDTGAPATHSVVFLALEVEAPKDSDQQVHLDLRRRAREALSRAYERLAPPFGPSATVTDVDAGWVVAVRAQQASARLLELVGRRLRPRRTQVGRATMQGRRFSPVVGEWEAVRRPIVTRVRKLL
jgi:hypothetical protein